VPSIADNLETVRDRLLKAQERSDHKADVALLAVSKTWPLEALQEALAAGQTLFGENKVQELMAKQPVLSARAQWHLIGHLQSNKVRKALHHSTTIHSIDCLDLARDVDRVAQEMSLSPKVYLEVNLAAECTKHGFTPADLAQQLEPLYELEHLQIQGLMCIPPFDPNPERSRPYFRKLRDLRNELQRSGGLPLPQLSMGMSHDFEVAIEEGSTIVRVGSAIFGQR
jgi:PLP dependent protein